LFALVAFCAFAFGVKDEPKAETKPAENPLQFGKPAPAFQIQKLLQAPADAPTSLEKMRGKAVVLEFWGIGCGPCIRAFPHLNKMVEKTKDESVIYIAVTEDPVDEVTKFLKEKPLNMWIAIDTDNVIKKAYGIEGIPQTVLIDPDGVVQGVTTPTFINSTAIKDLANRRPIRVDEIDEAYILKTDKNGGIDLGKATYMVYLGPPNRVLGDPVAGQKMSKSWMCGGELLLRSCYMEDAGGWQVSPRVVFECEIPDKNYGYAVKVPSGGRRAQAALLKGALEADFGFRTQGVREQREQDVLVLKHVGPERPGKPVGNPRFGGGVTFGENTCEGEGAEFIYLPNWLEREMKKPVFDETGLNEKYDWSVKFKSFELNDVNEGLKPIGLALTQERRRVEYIVVKKVDEPAKK
jgi:peroxiredoxin